MPIVLLHALPLDASMWDAVSTDVEPDVIAPTLYFYGDTLEEWARRIVDEAGRGRLVLVGNSIGGSCAVEVARLVPERVDLLVLVGAKAGHRSEPRLRDEAMRHVQDHGVRAAWDRYWRSLFGPSTDPATVARAREIAERQPVTAIVNGLRVFHGRHDRAAWLRSWPGRVVVISGVHDRTPRHGPHLTDGLRNTRWVPVPGAGHYVPLEAPDVLAQVVAEELSRS